MIHKILITIIFMSLIGVIVGCSAGLTPALPEASSETSAMAEPTALPQRSEMIILGQINDEPLEEIEQWQPLVDFLAANLSEAGIKTGVVKVTPNPDTLSSWLEAGEADFFIDSVYPSFKVSDKTGAQFIANRI